VGLFTNITNKIKDERYRALFRVDKLKLNLDKTKFQVVFRTSADLLINVCVQIDIQQFERV
jgi:hypothetical protein